MATTRERVHEVLRDPCYGSRGVSLHEVADRLGVPWASVYKVVDNTCEVTVVSTYNFREGQPSRFSLPRVSNAPNQPKKEASTRTDSPA